MTSTAVQFTGAPDDFDELAVFRFRTAERQMSESHAWQTTESRPLSAFPAVELDGDLIAGRRVQVHGIAAAQPVVQFGGRPPAEPLAAQGWRNNARSVSYTLRPIPGTVEVIP